MGTHAFRIKLLICLITVCAAFVNIPNTNCILYFLTMKYVVAVIILFALL